jgi:hypothetical protein
MRALARTTIVGLLLAASLIADGAGHPARAESAERWERIDPLGFMERAEYQAVRVGPDGSIFASLMRRRDFGGYFRYNAFLRKFDSAGNEIWTTPVGLANGTLEFDVRDLEVDGPGNPYLRICQPECRLAVYNPQTGAEIDAIDDAGFQNRWPFIGVAAGGVLVVSQTGAPTPTFEVRRLTTALEPAWNFDLTGRLSAEPTDGTWLFETSVGNFWAIGTKPAAFSVTSLVNFSSAGANLGTLDHPVGEPYDELWAARPLRQSPLSAGPQGHMWITTGSSSNSVVWGFSATTGALVGEVDLGLPTEQLPTSSGLATCAGRDIATVVGTAQRPGRFAERRLLGGSRFATVMRCVPLAGGSAVPMMVVYATTSPLGAPYVRQGYVEFGSAAAVFDMTTDGSGALIAVGSSATFRHYLLEPGEPDPDSPGYRAAIARNPTGNLVDWADFDALPPERLFDTRGTEPQGRYAVEKRRIPLGGVLRVKVAGLAGVPLNGAGAVSLNLTVANPIAPGYVTAYGCGPRPMASNVNFVANQTVANAVVVPVSAQGEVCFYAHSETDLLADVNGWFRLDAGFHAMTPQRLFDSRPAEPVGAIDIVKQRYGGDRVLEIQLGGVAGVPESASAVSLNVTATEPLGDGFVTVYPCGVRPLASNLNFVGGQTVPNAVVAPLAANGTLCFYSNVDVHLVADVNGYFDPSASLHTVTPTRLVDTRPTEPHGLIVVDKRQVGTDTLPIRVTGVAGVPPEGVSAVSLNVTATNPIGPGFVTVYPAVKQFGVPGCGDRPLASNVNFNAFATVPNAVLAPVSADGYVCFYSHVPSDLVVDLNGWFEA